MIELIKGKAENVEVNIIEATPEVVAPTPIKPLTLNEIQQTLSTGVELLGWIVSLSLGGMRVPIEDAHNIISDNGYNYDDWIRPPHPADAFRQTMGAFGCDITQSVTRPVVEVDGSFQTKVTNISHKYEIEKTGKVYYMTYHLIDPDHIVKIDAQKVARFEFNDDTKEIKVVYLDTPHREMAATFILKVDPDKRTPGILQDFEIRKTHYHHMHMREFLNKAIEQLLAVKWADNGTYFVPNQKTNDLSRIKSIVEGLMPYKTTDHKTNVTMIPLPDVEAIIGSRNGGGFRQTVADALKVDLEAKLKDIVAEMAKTLQSDSKNKIKFRNLKQFDENMQEYAAQIEEYKSLVNVSLEPVELLLQIAKAQITDIATVVFSTPGGTAETEEEG